MAELPHYVADTHSLLWYLAASPRLGNAAKSAFDEAHAGRARIIVPIIVLAELIFVVEKGRVETDLESIFRGILDSPNYEIRPLELAQIRCLRERIAISGMHDRLIVCEALLGDARLITNDADIRQAAMIEIVW